MKRWTILALAAGLLCPVLRAGEVEDRVVKSAVVLREIMQIPEEGIPTDLLNRAACVAVIPSMKKGGFVFGGNYGKGIISCRTNQADIAWSAPSMVLIGGGSFGLQIGAQAVDLVLVIMNLRGLESLLDSQFTLGGDASVAAGPVGRTAAASTDALLTAKILAYSRSRGLFGGLTLKGEVIRPDHNANHVLYGKPMMPRDILFKPIDPQPRDVKILVDELTRLSPKKAT